jgi:hypothetical protein
VRAARHLLAVALTAVAASGAWAARAPEVVGALAGDDTVLAFGSAGFYGSTSTMRLSQPVVGMAATPDGEGYWLVTRSGAVHRFGSARSYGSATALPLAAPVVGMVPTPTGAGYWLATADGGVFSFGDAGFHGSMGGRRLNAPIIAVAAAPDGGGYWLVARDGGIFTFGSARFSGSTGAMRLNAPVVGMAPAPDGGGYWLVASDGGIFSFGSARFFGSTGGMRLVQPVVGMAAAGDGRGYWLAARDGGVFTFGRASFEGSAAGRLPAGRRVVQITGLPTGSGYRLLALPIPLDEVLLARGASGVEVAALQVRLSSLGYWLGPADAHFGLLTEQAVTAFQKVSGIPRTGRVDRLTQLFLDASRRPRARSTSGTLVEVDTARQVIFVVRGGATEWVFNTSTGTERPYTWEGRSYLADTPVGRFTVSRQVDGWRDGELGLLYRPKYFHPDGIAFHGYSSVPPYPASHGCVRVTFAAIDWMWEHDVLPIGRDVWVY